MRRLPAACALGAWITAASGFAQAPAPPEPPVEPRPVAVRVQWGGGQARAWAGTISLVSSAGGPPEPVAWRTLSTEPDAAALVHEEDGTLVVHQPRPIPLDGVEIHVPDVTAGRIVAALGPAGGAPTATLDVAVAELLAAGAQAPLDADGNRLTVKPAPGEALRVTLAVAGGDHADIVRPGERLRCTVDPLLPERAGDGAPVELRMRLVPARGGAPIATQATLLEPMKAAATAAREKVRQPARFVPAVFEITLPAREGAYDIELEAVERASLGWSRPLAARAVEVLVLDAGAPPAPAEAEWEVVHELDPGSPRLHERLRRMPGLGLPAVPSLPLPAMPLPSLSRSGASRPRLPGVPLPPVPSLSSMVPRLSGLLATGDSRVEPHPLGPMLRLPPASDVPTWEGIVVAGVRPGAPHVVEIELPSDQECDLDVAVLELDADGSAVEARHAAGVEVRPPLVAGEPRLEVHRFVFWPTTRDPLLLLANGSREKPALFGRVRVRAGPDRLQRPPASAAERRVHAFLATPDFRGFGGTERSAGGGGRAATDWGTHVEGIGHAAELLGAQGAAGALVTVCSRGAALWPSATLRQAPRWGSGATDAGLDAGPRDVLRVLCDIFARERLRLVAGIAFDAPLPALEAALATGAVADGIACVGRDGRPLRRDGGVHYNVLDPRVQQAVEDVVRELAGRLRGRPGIDGVALLLPHDGWLHLPGVAWALDDATFGRFAQATGVESPPGDDARFTKRADLVEGPLRDRWLEWRAGEIARFHARLAELLAAHDAGWSLHVAPTTLFATGPLAAPFRPSLVADPPAADLLFEAGLDAARLTAHRRIVFTTPHVRGGAGLSGRGGVAAANRSPTVARAAGAAARHGIVLVEEPRRLDFAAAVPHGPFGGASARGPADVRTVAVGAERDRPLAEALVVADAEVVFDTALVLAAPERGSNAVAAYAALPARRLGVIATAAPPLVVRAGRDGAVTWLCLVNAAAAPGRAVLHFEHPGARVVDVVSGSSAMPTGVDVAPWDIRCLRIEGPAPAAVRIDYAADVADVVAERVAGLRERRAALEMPAPLEALDNPSFELEPAAGASLPGWELLQPRRSTAVLVAGRGPTGRGGAFASTHGLATLRSNPFPLPATGRLSIAAWLRVRDGDPQPPLRIALEGVEGDREYYRFAPVGGLAGGRPLTAAWSQFVLQIDDLPEVGLDALRVRFDLLGPGAVEIDDVRVFDLAFDEAQRARLSRLLGGLEERLAAGDVGGCLVALDGHWPRYLEARVPVPEAREERASDGGRRERKAQRDRWWR